MAKGINKCIFIGNLGQDPDIKHAASGATIASFSVAVNESWKDKQTGETQEKTEWVKCVAFNRLAEIIEQYLRKGAQVYVEGKLQTRSWEQDGVTKYMTEIVISEMQMLGGKNENSRGASENSGFRAAPAQSAKPAPQQQGDAFQDDDIPF